jgi:hypothetical protein
MQMKKFFGTAGKRACPCLPHDTPNIFDTKMLCCKHLILNNFKLARRASEHQSAAAA